MSDSGKSKFLSVQFQYKKIFLCLMILAVLSTAHAAWEADANARIEQLRKRNVTIQIVDSQGNPINNVSVSVNQKKNHFPFGTAISSNLGNDSRYDDFFVDNYNWAVFEDQVEWYWNEESQGNEEYSDADRMAQFCRDNDIKMRGHAVFWANKKFTPKWAKNLSDTDFRTAVETRLKNVVERYKDDFLHWDVNNEDMHFDYFRGRLGDSITKWMYDEIHKIDPDCVLLPNEYNIISEYSEINQYKTHIQNQLNDGVAIGAIGLQAHFGEGFDLNDIVDGIVDPNVVYGHYDNLSSLNLPIWVTEFDCPNKDENARADSLEKFYRISFSHAKVDGIIMWGFWEGQHWRVNCHLMDSDYRVNAAGLRYQKIRNEWKTNTSGTTTNGNYSFRGFHGKYDITLTSSESSVTQTIYLDPGVGTANYVLTMDIASQANATRVGHGKFDGNNGAALGDSAAVTAQAPRDFKLQSRRSKRLYGPFKLASDVEIKIGASLFRLVMPYGKSKDPRIFGLKSGKTGKAYGPFNCKDGMKVTLGKSLFTIVE